MSDGLFFFLAGFTAAVLIALALVWPQGLGAPSPFGFGHPVGAEAPASASAAALKGSL